MQMLDVDEIGFVHEFLTVPGCKRSGGWETKAGD
jgi:hypothetical protein